MKVRDCYIGQKRKRELLREQRFMFPKVKIIYGKRISYKGKITFGEVKRIIEQLKNGSISGKLQKNGWWIILKEDRKQDAYY